LIQREAFYRTRPKGFTLFCSSYSTLVTKARLQETQYKGKYHSQTICNIHYQLSPPTGSLFLNFLKKKSKPSIPLSDSEITLQRSGFGSFLHAPRISLTSSKLKPFSKTAFVDLWSYHRIKESAISKFNWKK